MRGEYGKSLLRRRGELVERSFAHCYETGGMRRTHLRGHQNILKRQLIHVEAFNLSLSLILRELLGAVTLRQLANRNSALVLLAILLLRRRDGQRVRWRSRSSASGTEHAVRSRTRVLRLRCTKLATYTTGS